MSVQARERGESEARPAMTKKRSAPKPAPADPCSFIIFGASGDLTHRLLVPALYNLAADGLLAPKSSSTSSSTVRIGSRTPISVDSLAGL